MRLLCDQNVAQRYIDAFIAAPDFHAVTVRDALDPRAPDPDIATYASQHDYVVFTSDNDFFGPECPCGFIYYEQTDMPPVGDVLTAVRAIRDAYTDYGSMVEVVPGGWI